LYDTVKADGSASGLRKKYAVLELPYYSLKWTGYFGAAAASALACASRVSHILSGTLFWIFVHQQI